MRENKERKLINLIIDTPACVVYNNNAFRELNTGFYGIRP